ncbi:sensor histidine kinase [Herbiconiux liukaitaii]|uniref:sensor histidine kinase n=1 Tax=Herbiconiux liukaitaii TaxID=3342799 RepID=UPI0035B743FB
MSGVAALVRRRPWIADAVVFAGYGLVVVCLALVSLEPRFGTPWWAPTLLGVAGLALLALRVRWPLPALAGAIVVAVLSLAVGTGAECLLVLITLYGVGLRRPAHVAWVCTGVAIASGALGAWVFTTRLASGPSLWGSPPVTPRDAAVDWALSFAAVVVLLLLASLLGTTAGGRRRRVAALEERAEQLARERDQQAEIASARERERIAREMHDVIAHSLSVMIAMADGAHAAAEERPDEAKIAIGRVAETGRRTLGEVRRLLGSVRGDDPAGENPTPANPTAESPTAGSPPAHPFQSPQPDATRLPALVEEFSRAGLPIRFTVSGPPSTDPAIGLTVYRIVQESLTNVLRHARGVRDVEVTVAWIDGDVTILVRDHSATPGSPRDAGRGILGMNERVALFGGTVEVGPVEVGPVEGSAVEVGPQGGGGWRVSARLPWEEERR